MRKHPKFVVKEMESMYMDELKSAINLLMANLESLPVSKGSTDSTISRLQKLKRYNRWVCPKGKDTPPLLSLTHPTPALHNGTEFMNSHHFLSYRLPNAYYSNWKILKCNFFWIIISILQILYMYLYFFLVRNLANPNKNPWIYLDYN